jgi:hypothetical protein
MRVADSTRLSVAVNGRHKPIHGDSVDKSQKHQKPADQLKAFRKAARAAGADDNEERFRDALRTVAKAKPSEKPRKRRQSD